MKRYQVVKGSESAHCCFEATVIDTEKEMGSHPDWVCECFEPSRAHAIADAMNAADEAPLSELSPACQDRCGKAFDIHSALLYFPGGADPRLVLPGQIEVDINTGEWEMYVTTVAEGHQYKVIGAMSERHPYLLKLEASSADIHTAF